MSDEDFLQCLYDSANQYHEEANHPFIAPEDREEARTALDEVMSVIADVEAANGCILPEETAIEFTKSPIMNRPDMPPKTEATGSDGKRLNIS